MNDRSEANNGPLFTSADKPETSLEGLGDKLGKLIAEMRVKRHMTQHDFKTPVRSLRRLEKGELNHITLIDHFVELKPCLKETATLMRELLRYICPDCRNCNPDCRMFGKDYREFENAVRETAGLKPIK